MTEVSESFVRTLLIIILISSLFYGNFIAIIISGVGLYGIYTKDAGLLSVTLVPYIVEVIMFAIVTAVFGFILLLFIILSVTDDEGDYKVALIIMSPIFLALLLVLIFQIYVLHIIKQYIRSIDEENYKKSNPYPNNNNARNEIQNTNIYVESSSSSVPPPLPPRQQSPNTMGYPSNNMGYPPNNMNYPPNNMGYPQNSLYPQNYQFNNEQNQYPPPPPYEENEKYRPSDSKH